MRERIVAVLALLQCWSLACLSASASGWYDDTPGAPWWEFDYRTPGGVTLIVDEDTTVWSLGGLFTKRRIIVKDRVSGEATRFDHPSAFHTPHSLADLKFARALVRVQLPDRNGLLYVNGGPARRGAQHVLTTPILEPGHSYKLHLRAAFRSGSQLLIEDRALEVHAGQCLTVAFDGSRAQKVSLPSSAENPETAPSPRPIQ